MIPTTTHKGFKITFNDEMEDWSCRELGKRSKSLKNLRSQIDNHVRNIRKGVAVDALRLDYLFQHQRRVDQSAKTVNLKPARVVEYLGESSSRFSSGVIEVAMIPEGGSRQKVPLSALYKDTEQNREIAERAHQKGLEAASAINQMQMILGELERLDRASVDGLARIANELS